jgi:hypothetical protein
MSGGRTEKCLRRDCPCEYHVKHRDYQRKRVEAKRLGLPPPGQQIRRSHPKVQPGAQPPIRALGRLVTTLARPGASMEVSHWMPKEETEWQCPECGTKFRKYGKTWREVSR